MPVVKANAYGHSTSAVVSALRGMPIWGYGLAYGSEALALRHSGWRGRELVMSYWANNELSEIVRSNIDLAIWDQPSWQAVRTLPPGLRRKVRVHLKLDSGTSRVGFLPTDMQWLKRAVAQKPFRLVGEFSHLANSEEAHRGRTKRQLKHFATLDKELGLDGGVARHIACTAAALRYPEARFGLIRLGIGLYGLWPSQATQAAIRGHQADFQLRPALEWKTRVSQIKRLATGTAIGYGSTAVVKRPTTIGVLPIGYADGYARAWSNRAWTIIRGRRAPIIGRVSMNLTMVDLSAVPSARRGDDVRLLGAGIPAETLAELNSTIHYEVTTRINSAIPRILI